MAEKITSSNIKKTSRDSGNSTGKTTRRSSAKKNVDLEMTNGFDITFDDNRLTDSESLDVSFIEGKKKKAPKIENYNTKVVDEEFQKYKPSNKSGEILVTILIIVASYILGFLNCYILIYKNHIELDGINVREVEKIKTEVVVDENYVFLGDSITEGYDLSKYYGDRPIVNSGISGYKTTDILNNMDKMVYRYNPSKVFILIGINDLNLDIEIEDVILNIENIVTRIKEKRPYAEIYLESVYPINNSNDTKINHDMVGIRSNEDVVKVNDGLKQISKDKGITYIDIYSLLLDDSGNLKSEYTTEGLHISDEGYEVITEELKKYIN